MCCDVVSMLVTLLVQSLQHGIHHHTATVLLRPGQEYEHQLFSSVANNCTARLFGAVDGAPACIMHVINFNVHAI